MTAGQILPPKRSNSELASTQTPERAGENKFPAYGLRLPPLSPPFFIQA